MMDSSFFLFGICTTAIGFFTIFGSLLFMVYKSFRSKPQKEAKASYSFSSSPQSPLSPLTSRCKYHVFPTFHGKDVRRAFLSHIIKEFQRRGITTFLDNKINRGKSIAPEIIETIRSSRISIVMLSQNYASSSWCLNELVEIMKCREELGQLVIPIFYEVDPADVKKQTGDFGKIFRKTCKGKTNEDTRKWKQALTKVATIAGYHSRNWDNEVHLIEQIAYDILQKLNNFTPSSNIEGLVEMEDHKENLEPDEANMVEETVGNEIITLNNSAPSSDFDGLVGMEAHMEKVERMLCLDLGEVKMVGISGPRGIGKTTIAINLKELNLTGCSSLVELPTSMENATNLEILDLRNCSDPLEVNINCGDEVQYSFASHLSTDFQRKGVNAVVNCNGTLDVIKRASASVVVFSKSYLSSTSCLDNLVRVLRCRRKNSQPVVPVFFGVSPSDVLVPEYGSADRIREWKGALRELRELPGHQSREECSESELVEEVVKDVYEQLYPTENIGIDSRLLEVDHLVCKQRWGIRRIGIWGMSGIGKTTLAKAVCNQIAEGYDAFCFIEHFDKAFHEKGLHRLLEEGKVRKGLSHVCRSITKPSLPRDRLRKKRHLVVLDDVHNPLVAESFLGGCHWFGPGSLIIITSRDKEVLRFCEINHVYEVQSLNKNEALQLFSQCAFGKNIREPKLQKLSMEVIEYSDGNPLALSFYGKSLWGKKLSEMETTLLKSKLHALYDIPDLFRSSYETLDDNEKNIFLDIACFFNGENVDYVMQLLDGCGFFPHVGINVLVEKCLVTISENRVKMHNLIQDFGREKINRETGERRLWEPRNIKFLLQDDKVKENRDATYTHDLGTVEIEGIFLDASGLVFDVKPGAFEDMYSLRFLKIYCSSSDKLCRLRLPKGLLSLPHELRLLHWENYPLQSLPQDFDSRHLVELNMPYSQLHKLWAGTKNLKKLKIVRFCHSQQLTDIDDICNAKDLELIDLQGCTKLQSFPAAGQLQHLRVVNLSDCGEITSFPEVSPNIEELHLQGTGIRELPASIAALSQQAKLKQKLSHLLTELSSVSDALNIEKLTSLVKVKSSNQYLGKLVCLNMKDCSHLQSLPDIVDLESLKVLNVSGCSELEHIQGFPRNLRELYLGGTAIKELPQLPQSLEVLNAHSCLSLRSIPFGFKQLPRHCTLSNCFALSDKVVSKYLKNALVYVECMARDYQQELKKPVAFSFSVSSPSKRNITFDLQSGSCVLIRLSPSWRSTLLGFAIVVEAAFSEDNQKSTVSGFKCVCRWKDKEGHSHRLEKTFHCWNPEENVQKFQKEHMFLLCDLTLNPSTSTGKDPDILADLIVFEIFPVNKQMELLEEGIAVKSCGVHVITATNEDTSLTMSQPVLSLDPSKVLSDDEVEEVVRGLDEKDRNIFLYIACLLNDEEADLVAPFIASIGLGSSGIEVIADNSLICVSNFGVIVPQNLLGTMGREIVRRQSMLSDNLPINQTPSFHSGEFVGSKVHVAEMSSLSSSKTEQVKMVGISDPSVKGNLSNLEELDLSHCSTQVEVPSSIGNLINLVRLNLSFCKRLVELPSTIGNLINLQKLNLSFCERLVELPTTIGNLINLQKLNLCCCSSLVELPSSVGNLINLKKLNLSYCSLVKLPSMKNLCRSSELGLVESLRELHLSECSLLENDHLRPSGTAIEEVPSSMMRSWPLLSELELSSCETQEYSSIGRMSRLNRLVLSGMEKLVSLPQLPNFIVELLATDCESLERLDCSFRNPYINLNFANCFKLNQEARDLIIQTSTYGYAVLPGGEVPACFTYRATGSSLRVKLNQTPCTSTRFRACIILAGEEECDQYGCFKYVEVYCSIRSKHNALTACISKIKPLDRVPSQHLYTFEVQAVEVTSTELVFEFELMNFNKAREIKECGIFHRD